MRVVLPSDAHVSCSDPGRLCAILGASGAVRLYLSAPRLTQPLPCGQGKTTLLNLVSGVTQTGQIGGEVRVNNELVSGQLMRRVSAFVQQGALRDALVSRLADSALVRR